MTTPVPPGDLTWLHMDRPNNLMYVHGLLWLAERPDWDAVEQVVRDRLIGRFPVFARRAAKVQGTWVWEDDPDFELDRHLRRVTLDEPGTLGQAQQHISTRFSQPFDRSRPLWEIDLIDGVRGLDGDADGDGDGDGAMVLARFHHGIADGVRLVQVLLSLLDPLSDDATPSRVGRRGRRGGAASGAVRAARHVATGTADLVSGMGSTLSGSRGWVTRLRPHDVAQGAALIRHPTRVVDTVTGVASEQNKLANTWRSLGRLTLSGRSVDTVWSGTPGVEKRVAWVTGLSLADVKVVGRRHGVTINDVLLAAVSLGVTDYLAAKGDTEVDQLNWLIPVSLKPIDAALPTELGNHFALVMLPMPLGISEPDRLLREIRTRMSRIKNSAEPAVLYGVQRAVAETPAAVSVRLTNYVADKAVGILTNVPGPRAPMALAGTEVSGVLGWVPTSGNQPLGVCIFSYNGTVNIGIASDAALLPDPQVLGDYIERAVQGLVSSATP